MEILAFIFIAIGFLSFVYPNKFKSIIYVVCSNCGKDMGKKEGSGIIGISHTVCLHCMFKLYSEDFTREEIIKMHNFKKKGD